MFLSNTFSFIKNKCVAYNAKRSFTKLNNNIPYRNVCLNMPKEYSDYENYEFTWG